MAAKWIVQRFFGAVITFANIIFKGFTPRAMARGNHNKLATTIGGFCRPDAAAGIKYCQQYKQKRKQRDTAGQAKSHGAKMPTTAGHASPYHAVATDPLTA